MVNRLSVDCIIKGEIPNANTENNTFCCIFKYCFLMCNFVRELVKKYITQMAETHCDNIVASAAPFTPISKTNINIGSNIIFSIAPIITVAMLNFANPCDVMNVFSPNESCTNNVPQTYIVKYSEAYCNVFSLAPKNIRSISLK